MWGEVSVMEFERMARHWLRHVIVLGLVRTRPFHCHPGLARRYACRGILLLLVSAILLLLDIDLPPLY
jgi:hypothetical protein